MRATVSKGETHQESFNSQNATELRDDRDATTLANKRDIRVECLAQRSLRSFAVRRMRIGEIPRAAVTISNVKRHAFGQILSQMRSRQLQDLVAFLVCYQTKCQFRHRLTGDDRLCPLPLITTADPIDLRGWSRPKTLK